MQCRHSLALQTDSNREPGDDAQHTRRMTVTTDWTANAAVPGASGRVARAAPSASGHVVAMAVDAMIVSLMGCGEGGRRCGSNQIGVTTVTMRGMGLT